MEFITGSNLVSSSPPPTTVRAMELHSMVLPMGSSPWNRLLAAFSSSITTGLCRSESFGTNMRPFFILYPHVSK